MTVINLDDDPAEAHIEDMASFAAALYQRLGRELRARRKERRLTQEELATKLGMRRTSIANMEAGRQATPLHVIYQMCEILEISVREFLPPVHEISIEDTARVSIQIDGVEKKVAPLTAQTIAALLEKQPEENAP